MKEVWLKNWWNTINTLAFVLGILMIPPAALYLNRFIPPIMINDFNIDLFISIILTVLIIYLIFRWAKLLVIILSIVALIALTINQISNTENKYTFTNVFTDYRAIVMQNWQSKGSKLIDLELLQGNTDNAYTKIAKRIAAKIDHQDSLVRNYAVNQSLAYFDEYHAKFGPVVRQLSLFKSINSQFKYVPDAFRDEYFASAHETILNGLGGDCDDHTILMMSTMKAIGARTRLVLTDRHVYPELYCGDQKSFTRMKEAIELLFAPYISNQLFYHEENGEYWINLDYSAKHPGGPYSSPTAYAIIEK